MVNAMYCDVKFGSCYVTCHDFGLGTMNRRTLHQKCKYSFTLTRFTIPAYFPHILSGSIKINLRFFKSMDVLMRKGMGYTAVTAT